MSYAYEGCKDCTWYDPQLDTCTEDQDEEYPDCHELPSVDSDNLRKTEVK